MAKKPDVRKQITEAKLAVKAVMADHLDGIAQSLVDKIMAKLDSLPDSQRLNAIKGILPAGRVAYQEALLAAMAVVASDALGNARKEIPGGKNVKLSFKEESLQLGEFEDLPTPVRTKVKKQQQLVFDTQMADLEKAVLFQFNHSVDSTDSMELIRADLEEAAHDYITGPAIDAGAGVIAAQVINETRSAFFNSDDDVFDNVEAFEFVNGDPVSEVCRDLAGTVFSKDDPNRFRYTPPLHFGCKSYIIPILKGNLGDRKISKLKPSTKEVEDTIQFSEGHECRSCGGFHA